MVTPAPSEYVGVSPDPHEQLVARVLVQLAPVLQLVQLDRAIYRSSSSPDLPSLSNSMNGMCTTFSHSTWNGLE